MDSPHLRIAVTTNSLLQCDANFVAARQVVFYDVNQTDAEFVDVVHFRKGSKVGKGPGGGKGCSMEDANEGVEDDGSGLDPLTERVESLRGCSVLFTLGLSDVAAVKVHDLKVFPVKSEKVRDIDDVIGQVQRLLQGVPPLWVRRAMRDGSGQRMRPQEEQVI